MHGAHGTPKRVVVRPSILQPAAWALGGGTGRSQPLASLAQGSSPPSQPQQNCPIWQFRYRVSLVPVPRSAYRRRPYLLGPRLRSNQNQINHRALAASIRCMRLFASSAMNAPRAARSSAITGFDGSQQSRLLCGRTSDRKAIRSTPPHSIIPTIVRLGRSTAWRLFASRI